MEQNLMGEQRNFKDLLQKMLPRHIVHCLMAERQPPFETSEVSLFFSDIYNFQKIANSRKFKDDPKLIVDFLNNVCVDIDLCIIYTVR